VNELIERIRRAEKVGTRRLQSLSGGRRRYCEPSKQAITQYGPLATGEALIGALRKLQELKKPGPQREDVTAWRELLTHFSTTFSKVEAEEVTEEQFLARKACDRYIRKALEMSMHTNASFGIKCLGAFFQVENLSRVAFVKAWGEAGFYEVYEQLRTPEEPSLRKESALITVCSFFQPSPPFPFIFTFLPELLPYHPTISILLQNHFLHSFNPIISSLFFPSLLFLRPRMRPRAIERSR
jgi:hypothetical protein